MKAGAQSSAALTVAAPEFRQWTGKLDHPRYDDCDEECLFCGRPLKSAAARWVHLVGLGAELLRVDVKVWPAEEDQGWFAVGSRCAKRVPRSFSVQASEVAAWDTINETK
jgi:hypothetical protein